MRFFIDNHARRHDPYAAFKTPSDLEALAAFKAGATLHTWRNTCPNNWWLTTIEGQHIELPEFELAERWGFSPCIQDHLKALGKSLGTADGNVSYLGLYPDGPARSESWVFDTVRVNELERQWAEVLEGIRQRLAEAQVKRPASVQGLSSAALSVLRLLKRSGPKYPYVEMLAEFQELETAGLARLRSDNLCFEATTYALRNPLPRGESARLVFARPRQYISLPA